MKASHSISIIAYAKGADVCWREFSKGGDWQDVAVYQMPLNSERWTKRSSESTDIGDGPRACCRVNVGCYFKGPHGHARPPSEIIIIIKTQYSEGRCLRMESLVI